MNVNQLDLNLLIALDALLDERSVTRAANRVGVTQSTMSGSLARLRRFFDDDLLVRAGRENYLSPLGHELAQSVREVMVLIESKVARRPPFNPQTDAHVFSIAATDYAMLTLVQPLLERISEEAPNVTLHLRAYGTNVDELITRGEVDLAITPGEHLELASEVMLTERWVCAVSVDHPEIKDELSAQQYLQLPHLVFAANVAVDGSMAWGDRQLTSMGMERRIIAKCESFLLLPFLLRGTRLVALVQERLGHRLAQVAGIKLLDPPIPLEQFSLLSVWHPSRGSDSALQWLRRMLLDVASQFREPLRRQDVRN